MSRARGGLAAYVLAFAVAAGAAARAQQEQVVVHEEGERAICSVKVTSYPGSTSAGGFGFVHVEAQNLDGAPHVVRVRIATYSWIGSNVEAARTVQLLPHERGRWYLPLPGLLQYNMELDVFVDAASYVMPLTVQANRGGTALLLSDRPQLTPGVLALAQALWPGDRRHQPGVAACVGRDAPADWRLYTAFDLVVVDGRGAIGRDVQDALRRFVHAGGRALVLGADRMPAGPLRAALENVVDTATVRLGLGSVTATPELAADVEGMQRALAAGPGAPRIWPLADEVQRQQRIPGLERAPVLGFLFVILLFAVAVGPVNFFLLRKYRRPLLALVTVPAIGFGTTALMFGYAIVNDGFGVRGVVRTWTLLDQPNREASTFATRTLFAGLSAGSLALGDDSLMLAPSAFQTSDRRSRHRWSFDGTTGAVEGAVLPARTATALVSARQGVVRERLRARVGADGDLELLTDGGVVPAGPVLLRDFDGGFWYGQAPVLRRCSGDEAHRVLGRTRASMAEHEVASDYGGELVDLEAMVACLLPDDRLPPGSYVATVASAPWLPEHGLGVDYERALHHVVGRMSREDVLR